MLGEQGVTEVFVDPNFSPDVVSPTAEPVRSLGVALELLEQLAPSTRPSG
jgi:hypothetical protein